MRFLLLGISQANDSSSLTESALDCVHAMGAEADVIAPALLAGIIGHPACRSFKAVRLVDFTNKAHSLSQLIKRHVAKHDIDMVIGVEVPSIRFLIANRTNLGGIPVFPMPDLGTLLQLNNKWEYYRLLESLDIPTPKTWLVRYREELPDIPLGYPVFLKPTALGGGVGISCFQSSDELKKYIQFLPKDRYPFVIQEYHPGSDYGFNLLADRGKLAAYSIQHYVTDDTLEFCYDCEDELLGTVQRILVKTGYTGVANLDLRIDSATGAIAMIECNPRIWMSIAASLQAGINFLEQGAKLAQGHNVYIATFRQSVVPITPVSQTSCRAFQ